MPTNFKKPKSGFAKTNGIELYYEVFGDETHPTVVLIMGLDAQCVLWSYPFIEGLVDAGFQVIRFDNRDIGLSTWLTGWSRNKPYTLEDMALDTIGLLDNLKIEKVHIIGASMGGMIAQRLAISHSKRILSLTSIMSSGFALDSAQYPEFYKKILTKIAPRLLKVIPISKKYIQPKITVGRYLATYKYLSGTRFPFNKVYFNALFTDSILVRKGQNPKALYQQFCAIVASGSRLTEMKQIKMPTLILHGSADKLVSINHSKKYAALIKGSKFVELEGVGHEVPEGILPEVHGHIIENLKKGQSNN